MEGACHESSGGVWVRSKDRDLSSVVLQEIMTELGETNGDEDHDKTFETISMEGLSSSLVAQKQLIRTYPYDDRAWV